MKRELWRREALGMEVTEASLAELRIDNRSTPTTKNPESVAMPCCANCTAILWDVPCTTKKLRTSPPHPNDPEDE
jgi:hypothetical protein